MPARGNRSALGDILARKNRTELLDSLEDQGIQVEKGLPEKPVLKMGFREFIDKYAYVVVGKNPGWIWNEISELLYQEMDLILKGKSKRLMTVISPRMGKSVAFSLMSAFAMASGLDWKIIWISSSGRLAETLGMNTLKIIEAMGLELHPRSRSLTEFSLGYSDSKASFLCRGVQSAVLGYEANLLICDDPLPNAESATGALGDRFLKAWGADYLSRLTPDVKGNSAAILCHQRLHSQDPAGRIIAEEKKAGKRGRGTKYRYLHVPYLGVEDIGPIYDMAPDHWQVVIPKGMKEGVPTNSRVTLERADEVERGLAPADFQCLYQGLPSAEQELCSWSPAFLRPIERSVLERNSGPAKILSLDLALTSGKGNDAHGWSVCSRGVFDMKGKYLVHEVGEWRCPVSDAFGPILELCERHQISQVLVERLGGGVQMLDLLRRRSGLAQRGVQLIGVTPKSRSKHARYSDVLGAFANGLVYVPDDAEWVDLLNKEMRHIAMRLDKADDAGDSLLYGMEKMQDLDKGGWQETETTWSRGVPQAPTTVRWGYGAPLDPSWDPDTPFQGHCPWD